MSKCRICRALFDKRSIKHICCGGQCAIAYAVQEREKADRKAHKVKLIAAKPLSWFAAKAQQAFNSFVRERDRQAGYHCISSGRSLDWTGNQVDAGHFRTRGAAPQLRYNPDNCHVQSKHDNLYKSGNVGEYRLGLIERIGLDRVLALEDNNTQAKYTRDDLMAIESEYKLNLKELKE